MKFKKLIVLMMPLTSISIEGGYRNCTKNDSAVIYAGQKRRIRQYVYEWGYPYAFIGLAPSSGQSGLTAENGARIPLAQTRMQINL